MLVTINDANELLGSRLLPLPENANNIRLSNFSDCWSFAVIMFSPAFTVTRHLLPLCGLQFCFFVFNQYPNGNQAWRLVSSLCTWYDI